MFPHPRLIALRLPRTARAQHFSTSVVARKWEGRQPEENTTRETDKHNVQQDASRDGKEQRAKGEGGIAQTEKGGSFNKKAKQEHPEAPGPVIGMNDERGGKGR